MKNIIIAILIIIASSLRAQDNSIAVEIKNIGNQINSPFDDYAPLVTADGSMMIFTSKRPLSNHTLITKDHIYHSNFDNNKNEFLDGIPFSKKINVSRQNSIATAISNDGQQMLICRKGENNNGDIFETHLSGWEWSKPSRLGRRINSEFDETSASISPDGKTIFFVSNREGGLGGYDIWYSMKQSNGKWGVAINLGAPINSPNDETSVFFHPDGKTLFYSSNGPKSMGGFDIFMSEFDNKMSTWSNPENLGSSINSSGDDLNFVMEANGKTGYYSSFRLGGLGEKDIYKVNFRESLMKTDLILLTGTVTDKKGNPIEAKIVVKDKSTDKTIGIFSSNSATGKYLISLPSGKNYELEYTADDYFDSSDSIDDHGKTSYEEIFKNIVLKSKKVFQEQLKR